MKTSSIRPLSASMTNKSRVMKSSQAFPGQIAASQQIGNSKLIPIKKKSKEDDYITSLQKQVYYLELEMRLMKDRELETKNKVGGYEVLFRDGVPLNEHFLALKTKYTNEKEQFEKLIADLQNTITKTEKENQNLQAQIEHTNKNYYDLIQNYSLANDDYGSQIYDLNGKYFNENNTLDFDIDDKKKIADDLENIQNDNKSKDRQIERSQYFNPDGQGNEKNEQYKKLQEEQLETINRQTEEKLLEFNKLEKEFLSHSKQKELEDENIKLNQLRTRLEGLYHSNLSKVTEMENAIKINMKYVIEEELLLKKAKDENERLQEYLDDLSKLNEEKLKQKVQENIEKQEILINSQIESSVFKMALVDEYHNNCVNEAKNLLETKNSKITENTKLQETIDDLTESVGTLRKQIIDCKNNINQLTDLIDENKDVLEGLKDDNDKLQKENDDFEKKIKDVKFRTEELQQKLELNSMLKDVDINELKMLTQNNKVVNKSIMNLISKWDKVNKNLLEIEDKKKQES